MGSVWRPGFRSLDTKIWQVRRSPQNIVARIVSELGQPAAIRIHNKDVTVAIPVAFEGDPASVRRPGRIAIIGRVVGKVGNAASISIHHIYI